MMPEPDLQRETLSGPSYRKALGQAHDWETRKSATTPPGERPEGGRAARQSKQASKPPKNQKQTKETYDPPKRSLSDWGLFGVTALYRGGAPGLGKRR